MKPRCVRLLTVVTALAILSIPIAPAVVAGTPPRLPTSEANWASFTQTERDAAIGYEYRLLQHDLAAGTAVVHEVAQQQTGMRSPLVTASYNCPIQWINYPDGTWTRGGGWTDASAPMYQIYAGQPGTYAGRFYRDGTQLKTWYSYSLNAEHSHEENWTSYDWKWLFESPHYFNLGYHGAQQYSGGTWQLGPNAYCSVSAQP